MGEIVSGFKPSPDFKHPIIVYETVESLNFGIVANLKQGQDGQYIVVTENGPRCYGIRRYMNERYKDVLAIFDPHDERYQFKAAIMHTDPALMARIGQMADLSMGEVEFYRQLNEEVRGANTITFELRSKLPGDGQAHPGMNAGLFMDFAFVTYELWGYEGSTGIEFGLSNIMQGVSIFFNRYVREMKANGLNREAALAKLWPVQKLHEQEITYLFDVRERELPSVNSDDPVRLLMCRHSRVKWGDPVLRELQASWFH